MWPPLRTTRRLRTFVLIAFVHQLNACPCGCLEQNGWYLAMRSLVASASIVTSPLPTTFGFEDFGVEEDHCDGDVWLVFVGQRSNQLDYRAGLYGFAADASISISSAGNVSPDVSLLIEHAIENRALEVRARSQVLRI
jgi:hypothetical protein